MDRQSSIARARAGLAANPPSPPKACAPYKAHMTCQQFGDQWARFGATWAQALRIFWMSDRSDKDVDAFATGFFGTPPAVHFVGFKDSGQFHRACAVFGRPDFIHRHWDNRCVNGGELAPHDTVVFARGDDTQKVVPFSFDDSAVM